MVKEKSDTPDQVASTEMQIYEALRRRGVAYAFADMMEWTVHERYISQLFQHLRKDPPQGYMKTSIQQLLRADRAVWTKIVEDNVTMLASCWEGELHKSLPWVKEVMVCCGGVGHQGPCVGCNETLSGGMMCRLTTLFGWEFWKAFWIFGSLVSLSSLGFHDPI